MVSYGLMERRVFVLFVSCSNSCIKFGEREDPLDVNLEYVHVRICAVLYLPISCEYGNEISGSIKCGEFLDQLQNQLASQEGLCSME